MMSTRRRIADDGKIFICVRVFHEWRGRTDECVEMGIIIIERCVRMYDMRSVSDDI